PSERSRVRFIMVDFDGTSSDLQQLAHTFANAVKAPQPVVALSPPLNGNPAALPQPKPDEQRSLLDEPADAEPEAEPAAAPAHKAQNGARKKRHRTPNPISDLDLSGGPKPFKEYYEEHAPKDHSKRYLVIAQWLKEYRNIAEIDLDHIYTCYRFLSMVVP